MSAIRKLVPFVFLILCLNTTLTAQNALKVESPNGGETWVVGTTHDIIWTKSGQTSAYVNLYYTIDNGSSWITIINKTQNDGNFNWLIPDLPNLPSPSCKIKVEDNSNIAIYDVSNNRFTISQPVIKVLTPNGAEIVIIDSKYNITWSSMGNIQNVKISYSTNSGSSWSVIENQSPNTGTFGWNVPNTPSSNCRVKVEDCNNTTTSDISNNDFIISGPSITVLKPNGGETWIAGTTQNITWSKAGNLSANVQLFYSTNGGAAWIQITNQTPNDGTFSWVVPNTPSAACSVKVVDYNNASIYDVSNKNFIISLPRITVTKPNGNEIWAAGTIQNITWSKAGSVSSNIKILYSTNSGNTWTVIINQTPNDGSFSWLVPNTLSKTCKVKLEDNSNPLINDESNNNFTISGPRITVIKPNGREIWISGTTQSITWKSEGNVSNDVKILYSTNSGKVWQAISNQAPNSGSYSWIVSTTTSAACRIKVEDYNNPAVCDSSNYDFTISGPKITILKPNGREIWAAGSTQSITWKKEGSLSDYVKVLYSTESGKNWMTVKSQVPNTGTFSWVIPNTPSLTCRVRVEDYSTPIIGDESNSDFTITTPQITLIKPNGGEIWVTETVQKITWSKAGSVSPDANIYYSTDGGISWMTLVSKTENDGTYDWIIPGTISPTCRVKIEDYNSPSINDISNNNFVISGPRITVLSPKGGENLVTGATHNIMWKKEGKVSDAVKIFYSTNAGTAWMTITAQTSNTGEYSWVLPNTPSGTCRVKVEDFASSSIYDISDKDFTISPLNNYILIKLPNGGEKWKTGNAYNITWQYAGNHKFVNVYYSTNSGAEWNSAAINIENKGSIPFVVPNISTSRARIKVQSVSNPQVFDVSNNDLTFFRGIDKNGSEEDEEEITEFDLAQNFPNPFNSSTIIRYKLKEACQVNINIYNALGVEVTNLVSEFKEAGSHSTAFDAGALSSGIYYYTLRAAGVVRTKKMILVK